MDTLDLFLAYLAAIWLLLMLVVAMAHSRYESLGSVYGGFRKWKRKIQAGWRFRNTSKHLVTVGVSDSWSSSVLSLHPPDPAWLADLKSKAALVSSRSSHGVLKRSKSVDVNNDVAPVKRLGKTPIRPAKTSNPFKAVAFCGRIMEFDPVKLLYVDRLTGKSFTLLEIQRRIFSF